MWWGVGLATVSAYPNAWYLLLGATLNTLLFLCVTLPIFIISILSGKALHTLAQRICRPKAARSGKYQTLEPPGP